MITSPKNNTKAQKEKLKLQTKLTELSDQIRSVRCERQKLENEVHKRKKFPKVVHKIPKKELHHPNLDFLIAEIAHSPYLTPPLDKYPSEMFQLSNKLRELRFDKQNKIVAKVHL